MSILNHKKLKIATRKVSENPSLARQMSSPVKFTADMKENFSLFSRKIDVMRDTSELSGPDMSARQKELENLDARFVREKRVT